LTPTTQASVGPKAHPRPQTLTCGAARFSRERSDLKL